MTKRNLLFPLAAALATLPLVIGVAAWQFPLRAAPQEAVDDSGVELQLGAARILHRTPIVFPDSARAKHLSGTVVANVTVDDKGEVTGAQAVSGPDELRKPVVQSILNWHFAADSNSAPHSLEIAVRFDGGRAPQPSHDQDSNLLPPSAGDSPVTVESVNLGMLPAGLRDKVSQAGVLHVGDVISRDRFQALEASLRNIDDHLRMTGVVQKDGKVAMLVRLMPAQTVAKPIFRMGGAGAPVAGTSTIALDASSGAAKGIRVGGNVQSANLIQQTKPAYPPIAKQARIQGLVRFNALIGGDGLVKNLEVVSGHPLLVSAALEAVKTWVYKPTLLNGAPVDVITTIDVNFTLSDGPPPVPAEPQQ